MAAVWRPPPCCPFTRRLALLSPSPQAGTLSKASVRSPALQAYSLPAEPAGKPQRVTLGSRVSGPTSGGPVTLQVWSGRRKPLRTAGLGMLASRPSDNLLRAGLPRAFSVPTWLGAAETRSPRVPAGGAPGFPGAENSLGVGEGSRFPVGASPSSSLPFLLHRSLPTSPCSPCPHLPLLRPGSVAVPSLPTSLGAPLIDQPPVVSVGRRGAAGHWTAGRGLMPAPPSPGQFLRGTLPGRFAGRSGARRRVCRPPLLRGGLWVLGRWATVGCWSLAGSGQPLPGSRQDGAAAPGRLAGAPKARLGPVLLASVAGVLWASSLALVAQKAQGFTA
ncbi:uncharacterized protein LOC122702706 isoform X1 [Cervus elaphus]|uniref:uncharacterized protein LOC122702706 isoform X1 n=2 Tax=Cervus elaphus TaxID=9860 RepID=UPI001CC29B6A|nr:uncharacterized protein LOC122702706 isoform X1 [Cervus elaphus]XP_043772380.1 uncharacterized protein LOC122702706 isoform X1 [Cervus elaphus]XP_043772381.1 uncharacterized protein LOC122702706 isoform X1 [Cervus elaphus]